MAITMRSLAGMFQDGIEREAVEEGLQVGDEAVPPQQQHAVTATRSTVGISKARGERRAMAAAGEGPPWFAVAARVVLPDAVGLGAHSRR